MTIAIGVFTGFSLLSACVFTSAESKNGSHRWGPWIAVAAGLIAMAVAS